MTDSRTYDSSARSLGPAESASTSTDDVSVLFPESLDQSSPATAMAHQHHPRVRFVGGADWDFSDSIRLVISSTLLRSRSAQYKAS